MKLNVSSKELLALHNVLYQRFDRNAFASSDDLNQDEDESSDDFQLRNVYNRLRAYIVSALSGKVIDPFDAWSVKQQEKINELRENSNLKTSNETRVTQNSWTKTTDIT